MVLESWETLDYAVFRTSPARDEPTAEAIYFYVYRFMLIDGKVGQNEHAPSISDGTFFFIYVALNVGKNCH